MSRTATPPAAGAPVSAVALLVALVVGIIGVAFRGSWGALRDAALAAHFDHTSASLYPFAVDGLLIVAVIAAVLLRHDRGARIYCMGIIGAYTVASWIVNFLHGIGMFATDPATGERPVPPWPVVVVIASLVIGSIFLGSHLLVYVWRHLFPNAVPEQEEEGAERPATDPEQDAPSADKPPQLPATAVELAEIAYRQSLAPDRKRLSQAAMAERFRISRRAAEAIQHKVRDEMCALADASAGEDEADEAPRHTDNGRVPVHSTEGA